MNRISAPCGCGGGDDEMSTLRGSHHNAMSLYKDWLGTPLFDGEKAHKLLHNHYHPKKIYAK